MPPRSALGASPPGGRHQWPGKVGSRWPPEETFFSGGVEMRLLLVEDDVMVASGIKLGLSDAGYAVDWVGSGERAEEVLQDRVFDAAIIDIGLPNMDGLELTRRLRRPDVASHAMPVLILTARDALHDRVQGLDLGADDYMIKPFELPELLARLRALLRRSQAATSAVLELWPDRTGHRQPACRGHARGPAAADRARAARMDGAWNTC
jgi:DNA-binding response OmpR family regulator